MKYTWTAIHPTKLVLRHNHVNFTRKAPSENVVVMVFHLFALKSILHTTQVTLLQTSNLKLLVHTKIGMNMESDQV